MYRESSGTVYGFLTFELDEGEWSASRPGCFTPGEGACSTQWIESWVGSRDDLEAVACGEKFPAAAENRNPVAQPVA
jgi:hypothetical protein